MDEIDLTLAMPTGSSRHVQHEDPEPHRHPDLDATAAHGARTRSLSPPLFGLEPGLRIDRMRRLVADGVEELAGASDSETCSAIRPTSPLDAQATRSRHWTSPPAGTETASSKSRIVERALPRALRQPEIPSRLGRSRSTRTGV